MTKKNRVCTMIREHRKSLGMTQEQLADVLKVDRTYICAIENGRRFPSWELMWQLVEILEIDVHAGYQARDEGGCSQYFRLTK